MLPNNAFYNWLVIRLNMLSVKTRAGEKSDSDLYIEMEYALSLQRVRVFADDRLRDRAGSATLYNNYDIGCLAGDHIGNGAFGAGLFEDCCICEKASGPEVMSKVAALLPMRAPAVNRAIHPY